METDAANPAGDGHAVDSWILTAGRRFTFSSSRRLARDGWSTEKNDEIYGAGKERRFGRGENYEAHLIIGGEPDPRTGMIVNLSAVKDAMQSFLLPRYDHRFLNLDTPPFDVLPPTPENLALRMLQESGTACLPLRVRPVAFHLGESAATGATAFSDGIVEREFSLFFSAARRTFSPLLSDEENRDLFGDASSPLGHGHGYRLRVVLRGPVDGDTGLVAPQGRVTDALLALHRKLDHKHLNREVSELEGMPMTTERLAEWIHRTLSERLPVDRVRLHETPAFFAEYDGARASLGLIGSFSAAHCLRLRDGTEEENREIFGKCANPNGHGHRYTVEATVAGSIDPRSGVLYNLARFQEILDRTLGAYDQRHLDQEVEDFREMPSTGENLVRALAARLTSALTEAPLVRVRLWETENNRFAVRRGETPGRAPV